MKRLGNQPELQGTSFAVIWRQLGPQWPRTPLVTHYDTMIEILQHPKGPLLKRRGAINKPFIRKRKGLKRPSSAKLHINWTESHWQAVLWIEQSTFDISFQAFIHIYDQKKGTRASFYNHLQTWCRLCHDFWLHFWQLCWGSSENWSKNTTSFLSTMEYHLESIWLVVAGLIFSPWQWSFSFFVFFYS